eukprot:1161833-Pelagomonas_calceolata.AAC.17
MPNVACTLANFLSLQPQASTPAAPVSLHYVIDSHDPHNRYPNAKELLYGTDVGEKWFGALLDVDWPLYAACCWSWPAMLLIVVGGLLLKWRPLFVLMAGKQTAVVGWIGKLSMKHAVWQESSVLAMRHTLIEWLTVAGCNMQP